MQSENYQSGDKTTECNLKEIFVCSASGNDYNDGSIQKPFKTVIKAYAELKRRISENKIMKGEFTIYLLGGVYRVDSTLNFSKEFKLPEGSSVRITSYPNTRATLTGGYILKRSWFEDASSDQVLENVICKDARSKILKIDLNTYNIDLFGKLERNGQLTQTPKGLTKLYIDGKEMKLAQYPNDNSRPLVFNEVNDTGTVISYGVALGGPTIGQFSTDYFYRTQKWSNRGDIWIDGILGMPWHWTYNRVEAIDIHKKTLKLLYCESDTPVTYIPTRGFVFVNVLEEIDEPGEYYIDRDNKILYIYPNSDFHSGKEIALSGLDEDIFLFDGVNNYTIENIEIAYGGKSAIASSNGKKATLNNNITIRDCDVIGFNEYGIFLNGTNNKVVNNIIHDIGTVGVYITGGNFDTLESSGNLVENNHIYETASFNKVFRAAVQIHGVGIISRNNTIHDVPHPGIIMNGNDNIIEKNVMYNCSKLFRDMGNIYLGNGGQNPWQRGNIVRNNYFRGYDYYINDYHCSTFGVYVDNGTQGIAIENNLFENFVEGAVFIHGGGYNTVENNVFKNCQLPFTAINVYLNDWAYHITKDNVKKWYKQKLKYTSKDLPHLRYKGLIDFYNAVDEQIVELFENSADSSILDNSIIMDTIIFSQPENVYSNNKIYNDGKHPMLTSLPNTNNKFYLLDYKNQGIYFAYDRGGWESTFTISNNIRINNPPFSTECNESIWTFAGNKELPISISTDIGIGKADF